MIRVSGSWIGEMIGKKDPFRLGASACGGGFVLSEGFRVGMGRGWGVRGGGSLIQECVRCEKSNVWIASDGDGGKMRTRPFAGLRIQQTYA